MSAAWVMGAAGAAGVSGAGVVAGAADGASGAAAGAAAGASGATPPKAAEAAGGTRGWPGGVMPSATIFWFLGSALQASKPACAGVGGSGGGGRASTAGAAALGACPRSGFWLMGGTAGAGAEVSGAWPTPSLASSGMISVGSKLRFAIYVVPFHAVARQSASAQSGVKKARSGFERRIRAAMRSPNRR